MNDPINPYFYLALGIALVILALISILSVSAFKPPKTDYKTYSIAVAKAIVRRYFLVAVVLAGALLGVLPFTPPASSQQISSLIGGFIAALMMGYVSIHITSGIID